LGIENNRGCRKETASSIYPGAEEKCNLIDDDCDNLVDENVFGFLEEEPIRLTNDFGASEYPFLVWTGSEFAMVWHDTRSSSEPEIYFARFDVNGNKLTTGDTQISFTDGVSRDARIAWSGDNFGVVWTNWTSDQPSRCLFTTVSPDGLVEHPEGMQLASFNFPGVQLPALCTIIWTGSLYVVPYFEYAHPFSSQMKIKIINLSGDELSNLKISKNDWLLNAFPLGIFNNGKASVIWTLFSSIQELDEARAGMAFGYSQISDDFHFDSFKIFSRAFGSVFYPVITFAGESSIFISWLDNRSGNWGIRSALLLPYGILVSEQEIAGGRKKNFPISVSSNSNLGIGLVWWEWGTEAEADDSESHVYFQRLTLDGELVGEPIEITSNFSQYGESDPFIMSYEGGFGIVWVNNVEGNDDIFYRRVGCLNDG